MKRLILLVSLLLLLTACSTKPWVPPAECVDQDSVILQTIPDVQALDRGLLTVQLTALETIDGYGPAQAVAVLDDLSRQIERVDGLTYAHLVGIIREKLNIANALAGASLFILGDQIESLNQPLPISPCDLSLVRKHIERQKVLVLIYGS